MGQPELSFSINFVQFIDDKRIKNLLKRKLAKTQGGSREGQNEQKYYYLLNRFMPVLTRFDRF